MRQQRDWCSCLICCGLYVRNHERLAEIEGKDANWCMPWLHVTKIRKVWFRKSDILRALAREMEVGE